MLAGTWEITAMLLGAPAWMGSRDEGMVVLSTPLAIHEYLFFYFHPTSKDLLV
jgi:hypothetical protein